MCLGLTFVVFQLSVIPTCLYIVGVPFSSLLSVGGEGCLRVFEEDIFISCTVAHMQQHWFISVTSKLKAFGTAVFSLPELCAVGCFPFSWEAFCCSLIDLIMIVTVWVILRGNCALSRKVSDSTIVFQVWSAGELWQYLQNDLLQWLGGHFKFWGWSWPQTPWARVTRFSTDKFISVESCLSCCFTNKSAENFFWSKERQGSSEVELTKFNLKIVRSKTVPHVSAVQEGNLFRSLDLHSYISSWGYKLLIRSAIVYLCSLISVKKFHSTWVLHSTSLPDAPCSGCPSLKKWDNPIILPG